MLRIYLCIPWSLQFLTLFRHYLVSPFINTLSHYELFSLCNYYFGGLSWSAKYLVALGKRKGSGKSGVPSLCGFKQSLIA